MNIPKYCCEVDADYTIDMKPIVHCAECRRATNWSDERNDKPYKCRLGYGFHDGDWYCADGERKNGEQNG